LCSWENVAFFEQKRRLKRPIPTSASKLSRRVAYIALNHGRRGMKTDSRLFNSAFSLKVLPKIPSGRRARARQKSLTHRLNPGVVWIGAHFFIASVRCQVSCQQVRFSGSAAKLENHHLCRALGNASIGWFCIDSGRCRRSVKPSGNGRYLASRNSRTGSHRIGLAFMSQNFALRL